MGKAIHNNRKREMLYMAQIAGKQKVITIDLENGEEKKYILQHPGARAGMELRDKAMGGAGGMEQTKLWEGLMQKVIFLDEKGTKSSWDYWELEENFNHQSEVFNEATRFLMGQSRK